MKAYTDLKQSKKLAEILPIESADMRYVPLGDTHPWFIEGDLIEADAVPCWSLAALLNILPNYHITNNGITGVVVWSMDIYSKEYPNLIDACVEMILKLHKCCDYVEV